MTSDRLVTVSRTVTVGANSVTETAWAELADDVVLDAVIEAHRRAVLASLLFSSLPSVQSKRSRQCQDQTPPPPPPPPHSRN